LPVSNAIRGTLILLATNAKATNPYLDSTLFNFQFNPENLTHTFTSSLAGTGNIPQSGIIELFNLIFDVESDDIDPQEKTSTTQNYGLHPVLAIFEAMAQPYPAEGNQTQMPTVIFKWGTNRVAPTKVANVNVDEIAFDNYLNPTKATVHLSLRVIQLSELKTDSPAHKICSDHQNMRNKLVGLYKSEHPQLEQSAGAGVGVAAGGTVQQDTVASAAATSILKAKAKLR
jgi:hypothetical protein